MPNNPTVAASSSPADSPRSPPPVPSAQTSAFALASSEPGAACALLNAAEKVGARRDRLRHDVYTPRRDEVKARSAARHHAHGLPRGPHQTRRRLHRHARPLARPHSLEALAAGKDVYLEKPVTHTIEEGAALTKAVRSSKQILQCGMQQRSWPHFRRRRAHPGRSLGRWCRCEPTGGKTTFSWQPKPVDTSPLDWKRG